MASASTTIDPLVPLALLEAVRDADRPEGIAEAEYVPELLNKRLGTTDTVLAQIRRYAQSVQRGRPVSLEEVSALARLVTRRPDAEHVFQIAGESVARTAYARVPRLSRTMLRILPQFVRRPLARRRVRKVAARYLTVPFDIAYREAATAELNRLFSLVSQ